MAWTLGKVHAAQVVGMRRAGGSFSSSHSPGKVAIAKIDAQKRELDRTLEQQVAVRHRADGDEQVEKNEQVAKPETRADPGGIDDRSTDCFEIVGLCCQSRDCSDGRFSSIGRLEATQYFGVPAVRALYEATYLVGL